MTTTGLDTAVTIRPYAPSDEPAVLALLVATLGEGPGGQRSPEFFRWKHLEGPFGESLLLVAEVDEQVVGLRAFMRWRFVADGREITAVRAVDTATHPDHQGRGIFSQLTVHAVELLRESTDLVFNTPNSKSGPGYLKLGWQVVGEVPVWIRVRRPVGFARGLRSATKPTEKPRRSIEVDAATASEVLVDTTEVRSFLEEVAAARDSRLATPIRLEYLRWRYADAPLGYRAILDVTDGHVGGVAIFRVRPRGRLWEATVAEVLVRPGDRRTAARLLSRVSQSSRVDDVTCHFPRGSAQLAAARRMGFLRLPRGQLLAVNPLRPGIVGLCSNLNSWAVSLGTLEVF